MRNFRLKINAHKGTETIRVHISAVQRQNTVVT